MRILIAFICGWIWCGAMGVIMSKTGLTVSDDMQFLSFAIVVAGALAGGD